MIACSRIGISWRNSIPSRPAALAADRPCGDSSDSSGRNVWLRLRGGWYRFGYAVVNFGAPMSLRAYVAARESAEPATSFRARNASRNVETLARDLMSRGGGDYSGGARRARGDRSLSNRRAIDWLDDLEWKSRAQRAHDPARDATGRSLYIPRESRSYALEAGLRMLTLRHLLEEQDGDRYRDQWEGSRRCCNTTRIRLGICCQRDLRQPSMEPQAA